MVTTHIILWDICTSCHVTIFLGYLEVLVRTFSKNSLATMLGAFAQNDSTLCQAQQTYLQITKPPLFEEPFHSDVLYKYRDPGPVSTTITISIDVRLSLHYSYSPLRSGSHLALKALTGPVPAERTEHACFRLSFTVLFTLNMQLFRSRTSPASKNDVANCYYYYGVACVTSWGFSLLKK